jgi:hypothetical protein
VNRVASESLQARQNEKRRLEDELEALGMPSSASEFNLLEPNRFGPLQSENERVKMKNSVLEFNSGVSDLICAPIDWNLTRPVPIYWSQSQFGSTRLESGALFSNLMEPKSFRVRQIQI